MRPDFLLIGDIHGQISRYDELRKGLTKILELIKSRRPVRTILSGDQFHNFAMIRSEILTAWYEFLDEARQHTEIVALVGNHDYSGPSGGAHAMAVFRGLEGVLIVDTVVSVTDGVWALPFVRDAARFESVCRALPAGLILFCHQEFNGAQYENGYYAPFGAPLDCVSHLKQVFSGHIHKRQQLLNIQYIGTPWQSGFSDAGEVKGVFFGAVKDGAIELEAPIDLGLPRYHVLESDTVPGLLESLPVPIFEDSYRLSASGTPQEIDVFWKDPRIISFKSKVRRLDNGMRAVREAGRLTQVQGQSLMEKVTSFINLQKWKVNSDRLAQSAGRYLGAE